VLPYYQTPGGGFGCSVVAWWHRVVAPEDKSRSSFGVQTLKNVIHLVAGVTRAGFETCDLCAQGEGVDGHIDIPLLEISSRL
jgi:hypothetical protein